MLFQSPKTRVIQVCFFFGITNDAVNESNVFSDESTFYEARLLVIDKIREENFQALFCSRN